MNQNTTDSAERVKTKPKKRATYRRWIPYAGGLLLLALIAAGFWPHPTPVETARVSTGTLRATVNEEGKTRIKNRFVVSAPVTGLLRRIPLKSGDPINDKSMILAVIDPLPPSMLDVRSRSLAEARRDTAGATLDKARAAHKFATSELHRFDKLFADKTLSPQELEGAQWRETSAAKEEIAAQSALRQAEAELAEFAIEATGGTSNRPPAEVKAPICGQVLRVLQESARVVTAGTPLMEVGDPRDLEVVIEVLSRDGAAITSGTRVELDQWGGGEPLAAKVRLVEPAAFTKVSALGVEEQRVNVVADITTPPEQRRTLGDNFRVEARIIIWESDKTLKVPSGALFRHGSDWAAFVVENGSARLRTVKVGRSSGNEMQVESGLKEGEEVVLYPGERVKDGQRIKPVKI
jgi:HlyD family secretion protein